MSSSIDKALQDYSTRIVLMVLEQLEKSTKELKGEETPEGRYKLGYRDAIDTAVIRIRRVKEAYLKQCEEQ